MARSPYKRRRPSLVRNFWVYRRMVLLALVLGLTLWFIVINSTPVDVTFPFGLGVIRTRSGLAILMGAVAGSLATALTGTIVWAMRRRRHRDPEAAGRDIPAGWSEDRPPPDYAAKTPEGFPDTEWPGR